MASTAFGPSLSSSAMPSVAATWTAWATNAPGHISAIICVAAAGPDERDTLIGHIACPAVHVGVSGASIIGMALSNA